MPEDDDYEFILFSKFSHYPDLQNELRAHQTYYYLISLITAGVSTLVKITTDWAKQTRVQQELETRTMQTELNFLKSQINPHFLFNTLNSLYAGEVAAKATVGKLVELVGRAGRVGDLECVVEAVILRSPNLSPSLRSERQRHPEQE